MGQEANEIVVRLVAKALRVPPQDISDETSQESTANWTSVRHLLLVTEIERTFGISLTTQDIIALKSVLDIKRTLRVYGVNV
jgi:acyl carrier protein